MTSKIKVDNINKVSDDSNIIKKCGTTTTIGSGASNPIVIDGSAVTIGRCGGTVALASGASQTGFGREGSVDWQTTIKTGDFTAVSGEGYFVNTTSGAITMTLPASPSAGAIVSVKDYANTFDTNALTVGRNGSNIDGGTDDPFITKEGGAATFVYGDATKGWQIVEAAQKSDLSFPEYIVGSVSGSGNTLTTVCTNFKLATFTGPGTFTVCSVGNATGSNTVSYTIIAGGGGGGGSLGPGSGDAGGGGGAGGFRESKAATDSYTASPLNATSGPTYNIPVSAQGYPVVVGAGGVAGAVNSNGSPGGDSSVFSITSEGGGEGKKNDAPLGGNREGSPGGSGGGPSGGGTGMSGGNGNDPPVSPPQGNPGSSHNSSPPDGYGGGGGGAGAAAVDVPMPGPAVPGGAGIATSISGSSVTRSGGGGGGGNASTIGGSAGAGGGGIGGNGGGTGTAGTVNTGGGAGGGGANGAGAGGTGGSGIVMIRYKFQ